MAIFGLKNKKTTETKVVKKTTKTSSEKVISPTVIKSVSSNNNDAIIRPRITEKSGTLSSLGVYTFEVRDSANKNTIAQAITSLYKVVPVKIAIVNLPAKNVFVRGRKGRTSGVKKALVTLKKGDKIDFI